MKNKFFPFFLVTAVAVGISTHTLGQNQMTAGAKGSFSLSTIHQTDAKTFSYMGGYSAGLYFDFKMENMYGVTIEANFHRKGAKDIDLSLLYSPGSPYLSDRLTKADIEFQTIEIPLLFNYYFMSNEPISLKAFVGPSFELFLSGKSVRYMQYELPSGQIAKYHDASDIKDRLATYDIAGVGGIGVDVDMKPFHITVDARYRLGFMDINNVASRPDFTQRGFLFVAGVGYSF
jgi:hypothetical protein